MYTQSFIAFKTKIGKYVCTMPISNVWKKNRVLFWEINQRENASQHRLLNLSNSPEITKVFFCDISNWEWIHHQQQLSFAKRISNSFDYIPFKTFFFFRSLFQLILSLSSERQLNEKKMFIISLSVILNYLFLCAAKFYWLSVLCTESKWLPTPNSCFETWRKFELCVYMSVWWQAEGA